MNFDLAKRRFSYSREELLQYRNNDVILPRPVRKAIFKHGLWLPRYYERNSRFRSARLRGYQARAHAQGHRWLPINTGRPPGCGDGNHLTVQPRMTSSRGISFRTAAVQDDVAEVLQCTFTVACVRQYGRPLETTQTTNCCGYACNRTHTVLSSELSIIHHCWCCAATMEDSGHLSSTQTTDTYQ